MPPENRDAESRLDILAAAERIRLHLAGRTLREFEHDSRTEDAVLYRLVVIGEAVTRLSPEFESQHPSIPGRDIRGLRNFVVHEYERVSTAIIWNAATVEVPRLAAALME